MIGKIDRPIWRETSDGSQEVSQIYEALLITLDPRIRDLKLRFARNQCSGCIVLELPGRCGTLPVCRNSDIFP